MKVYMDHAATTPMYEEAITVMTDYMRQHFGNPSSLHHWGGEAKEALELARSQVAGLIQADPKEIYFTSGGTEADNLAIFGAAEVGAKQGKKHIITSAVEHHAVLDTCRELEQRGYALSVLPVDEYGMVQPEALAAALRDNTALVSIMHANNEVGTVNPIPELAALAHQAGAVFHTDVVQSVGKIACTIPELGVDLLTYSSHKINGPKGVGALYVRTGLELDRQVFGGGQERKLRSGTENMPGIVGFGKAAELTAAHWQEHAAAWKQLRDSLVAQVSQIPYSYLNGHPTARLPHNANFSFDYIEGEALLLHLDLSGIACSSGSACSSGESAPSHVLTAMGLTSYRLHSALRFALGLGVDQAQVDYVAQTLQSKVSLLRAASPFYPGK